MTPIRCTIEKGIDEQGRYILKKLSFRVIKHLKEKLATLRNARSTKKNSLRFSNTIRLIMSANTYRNFYMYYIVFNFF